MKRRVCVWTACVGLAVAVAWGESLASAAPAATRPASRPEAGAAAKTVAAAYPRLGAKGLAKARPAELPEGVLIRAGGVEITDVELRAAIAKAPEAMRAKLAANAFFLAESMATDRLLVAEADAAGVKADGASKTERLQAYFEKIVADVAVGEAEIAAFYEANKAQFGGRPAAEAKAAIVKHLTGLKRRAAADAWIAGLGERTKIEVSAPWLARQAALAMDNPVGAARRSGKPSLVDFGAKTCRPCKMLEPILDALRVDYAGRVNVLFVSVRTEQLLAARYGVRSIPVQIFFDADGNEVFRHAGFAPREMLEKKLAEMGVK